MDCEHQWVYYRVENHDNIVCLRCYAVKWFMPSLRFENGYTFEMTWRYPNELLRGRQYPNRGSYNYFVPPIT